MKWYRKNNKRESIRELEQQRIEKLAELGAQLGLQRQQHGWSLETVAAKTRIQRRILHAIEHAQMDELPEPIYIQGFIKQYADALGLNGLELSSSFPLDNNGQLSIKPSWRELPAAQLRPIHLYLLYIFVIICTVNALSYTLSRSELQASRSQTQEKLFLPSDSKRDRVLPKQSEKFKSVSITPSAATEISKPVQISVTLKAQSWIRVVADGKIQFEGLLPEGTQRTWVAKEQLSVRAGNAGGVLVTFNQEEKAKQMGDPGEVREVTLAANTRS
jgi:cytoskeletal protein RodZ